MSAGISNDTAPGRNADHYPIIVIGGGPTGLTLANLLSVYGTRALLVERNATTVQEPRAVSIDDESLRTMQAAGVIDTVLTEIVAGYGSEYYTPKGRLFLKVEPSEQPYGYPRRNAFRQPVFEAQLRDALANSASVETWFGWELSAFKQDETGVHVDLVDQTGAHRSLRCDYLVGADGARSAVRSALGLSLDGETFQEEWLIVDLENSPTHSKETLVFCDVGRPCIALPGPNQTRRFEFKLHPGEDPEAIVAPGSVNNLLAAHGAHPDSRVCRKTVYTFHARVAAKWSVGRVFLAGDACHLTPPFAGQGMNSGIRDAHNLAWKLAWVTAGRSPARLLESYQSERREHVRDMIQLALRMGRIMGPRNRIVGHFIQTGFRIMGVWPRCRDYFAQMKYKPKPRFEQGFIIPDKRGARDTLVGRLLPQPVVLRPDGTQALLDDVLGDGFSIIFFDAAVKASFDQHRNPVFARLNPKSVLATSLASAGIGGEHDVIVDAEEILLAAAGGDRNRVLLVRPDRYVLTTFVLADLSAVTSRLANLMM